MKNVYLSMYIIENNIDASNHKCFFSLKINYNATVSKMRTVFGQYWPKYILIRFCPYHNLNISNFKLYKKYIDNLI